MTVSFSLPDLSELEIAEVADTLRSGWITTGPRTKKLERELANYVGTARCVCLNSQSACAELALRIMGIGPGDEVIVPAYTYTASASVVCHVGAKLVLIDSQREHLEMDYKAVEAAVNENTKAIIPVDLAGVPCDYDRIFEIVERKRNLFRPKTELQRAMGRIAVMADAAHAIGSRYGARMVGNVADFSSFSFHAVKNMTTAEGGALTWRSIPGVEDDEIYNKLQLMSLHGQSKDAYAKASSGSWEYDILGIWYKCNMTDITAAVGLKQFERYPGILKRRKEIIERYDAAFRPIGIDSLDHFTHRFQSCGHLYLTKVPGIEQEQRNEIITKMAERGICCNVHYKPLPMHTAYRMLGFDIADFPNAYAHYVNEISLPLHTCLTDEQVEYVIRNYTDVVKEYLK